jgi:hypothetical protein
VLKAYLRRHGKPVAFHSDKHSIFRVSNEKAVSGNGMTQFGRALSELNIEILCANTSQAKGRVERAHYTLQDRLVKELIRQRFRLRCSVMIAQPARHHDKGQKTLASGGPKKYSRSTDQENSRPAGPDMGSTSAQLQSIRGACRIWR